MAATGILRASDVIFYHPLNNLTELTQSQAWTGTAGFVPGKIGSAESALVGDTPVLGTPITPSLAVAKRRTELLSGWTTAEL